MSTITKPVEVEEEINVLDPVSDILLKAERYIRDHGWCKGRWYADSGRVCIEGAIYTAAKDPAGYAQYPIHVSTLAHTLAKSAITRCKQLINVESLSDWNDDYDRNLEDVYDLLRQARNV